MVREDIGDLYKVRLGFPEEENHTEWYTSIDSGPSWFLEKVNLILAK